MKLTGRKNLPFATRLERVKGLPNPAECQRATDVFLKTRCLLERGGGIVFATGTPIANTIAESWTMARYLMLPTLEELGLHYFDAWAKLFADTVVTLEQTVTGAYRPTARFARFKNVPEWLQLFQLAADIRMGSEVPELERLKPRVVGGEALGKRIYRTAAATPELLAFMEHLADRVEHLGPPQKGADNMRATRSREVLSARTRCQCRRWRIGRGNLPGHSLGMTSYSTCAPGNRGV
jgi:N12 class adenine-specific DNA methylase